MTINDYKVPGLNLVIPKGTPVYIPLFGLQNDAKYFPEPDTFNPNRFADENKDKLVPFSFIPFGEGPRICIGNN
jgi:cytochrome P450 family 6